MRLAVALLWWVVIAWPGAVVADSDDRPTTRVVNCTEGGCHSEQLEHRYLHAPVATSDCLLCHAYSDAEQHKFVPKKTGVEMCSFCHAAQVHTEGLQIHEPVLKGECLKCHDPHGSKERYLILGGSSGELCVSCHEEAIQGMDHLHTAVSEGNCLGCHAGHTSASPKLLLEEGRGLCLRCHENMAAPSDAMSVHEPLSDDCAQCHAAHGSNEALLLKEPPVALCASCHIGTVLDALDAAFPHSAGTDECGCLNCHTAHHSREASLLVDNSAAVCLTCHQMDQARPDGSLVQGLAQITATDRHLHQPIVENRCQDCHNPHDAQNRALLVGKYPTTFYREFEADAYSLCFTCHDLALATVDRSTVATEFRNGDQNLHQVHVNSSEEERGRSCRSCHDVHSSESPALMRRQVTFGNWTIPIEFERTENGGTCAAGCHREREYDRLEAIPSVVASKARPKAKPEPSKAKPESSGDGGSSEKPRD